MQKRIFPLFIIYYPVPNAKHIKKKNTDIREKEARTPQACRKRRKYGIFQGFAQTS